MLKCTQNEQAFLGFCPETGNWQLATLLHLRTKYFWKFHSGTLDAVSKSMGPFHLLCVPAPLPHCHTDMAGSQQTTQQPLGSYQLSVFAS